MTAEIDRRLANDPSIEILKRILLDISEFSKAALYEREVFSAMASVSGNLPLFATVMIPMFQRNFVPQYAAKNNDFEEKFLFPTSTDARDKDFFLKKETFSKFLDTMAIVYPAYLFNYILQIKSHGSSKYLLTNRLNFADAADVKGLLESIDKKVALRPIKKVEVIKEKIGLDAEGEKGLSMMDVYEALRDRQHMFFPIVFLNLVLARHFQEQIQFLEVSTLR